MGSLMAMAPPLEPKDREKFNKYLSTLIEREIGWDVGGVTEVMAGERGLLGSDEIEVEEIF